jgi:hypothetical protein
MSPLPSTRPTSHLRLLVIEPSPRAASSSSSSNGCQSPSLIPPLLQALTGEAPLLPPASSDGVDGREGSSFAGYTTHSPVRIKTRYFDTRVGLWCDEVPLPLTVSQVSRKEGRVYGEDGGLARRHTPSSQTEPEEEKEEDRSDNEEPTTQTWLTQLLSPLPEAIEVRGVIGAIILAIPVRDALEPLPSFSSAPSATDPILAYDDDDDSELISTRPRSHNHYKLRPEYLDVIEAVDTLRTTIEEEKPGYEGATGDIGAVILLQGVLPTASSGSNLSWTRARPARTAPSINDRAQDTATDELADAVEAQLLSDRAILGWDVITWDAVPSPSTTHESGLKPESEDTTHADEKGAAAAVEEVAAAAAAASTTERASDVDAATVKSDDHPIPIPALHTILHNIDWTALPHTTSAPDTDTDLENTDFDSDLTLTQPILPTSLAPLMPHNHQHDHHANQKRTHPDTQPRATTAARPLHAAETEEAGEDEAAAAESDETDEASQVDRLPALVQQALAMRDVAAGLPPAERERYARRMVRGFR